MALQHEYTTESGITLPEAYTVITAATSDKTNTNLVTVTFASAAAKADNRAPVGSDSLRIDNDSIIAAAGDTLWAKQYNWLKTQDGYNNATDV